MEAQEKLVIVKREPLNAEAPVGALRERLTPAGQFYVRNNFPLPGVSQDGWRLRVGGAVESPFELTWEELRTLPARSVTTTMECAGNNRTGFAPLPTGEPWGVGAVSTAIWRGVSVRDVLDRAGVRTSAIEILFEGADSGKREGHAGPVAFARSLPTAKALDPDMLLAYEFNGASLPTLHGGPVRLVVPGWYGMASVKWVVRIAALEEPFSGHFQVERYVLDVPGSSAVEPVREMRVKSLITSHSSGDVLPRGKIVISGKAWSGRGKIVRVDVSTEGEGGWQPAVLVGDNVPYTWQEWEYEWAPPRAGRYVLRTRATDEGGDTQPDVATWNRLGYVNNAIQYVVVEVEE